MQPNSFAWNLTTLMAQRGYTVNQISERSGLPAHQIRRLRAGTRKTFTQQVVLDLAAALEVTPNQLLVSAE